MNALTTHDLIQALRALLEETPLIFAEPNDALYFRAKLKSSSMQTPPPKPISPVIQEPIKIPTPAIFEPIKTSAPAPVPVEPKKIEPIETILTPPTKSLGGGSPLFALLQRIAPHISTITEIPSDAAAKKIATRWKTRNQTAPISILSFQEPSKQKALLVAIAKAIDICFGPARLIEAEPIEKEKQWETFLTDPNLKVIVACDYTLWQLENLMRSYKENSFEQTRMLGNIPLLLLPDLSLYLKDPLLKRSLWKGLCQKLSS